MIINGNYYPAASNNTLSSETHPVDSLATHMKSGEETAKNASDTVSLSKEAYAALKEQAPEALAALGLTEENPALEAVKQEAKEKYFHFGSKYLDLPDTTQEMIEALDVASKYMEALESISPDEIYEAITGSNLESAESAGGYGTVERLLEYV